MTGGFDLRIHPGASPIAWLILAHGAGAGQASPFIARFARGMAERGISTATFDFPYMAAGRKVPDRTPVLEASWRSAIETARDQLDDLPLFIGGKSMGGRIASHVAAQGGAGELSGVIFLGYPLHPPGKPDQRRDAHLPRIVEPMLFVQGSRDAFGTGDEIRAVLPSLSNATIHEIHGGDHSFKVPGGAPAQELVMTRVLDAVGAWIKSIVGT